MKAYTWLVCKGDSQIVFLYHSFKMSLLPYMPFLLRKPHLFLTLTSHLPDQDRQNVHPDLDQNQLIDTDHVPDITF